MDVHDFQSCEWFYHLAGEVRSELERLGAQQPDRRAGLELELQKLCDHCRGWTQTLAKPDLSPAIRAAIESEWEVTLARQHEIEAQLTQQEGQQRLVDELFNPNAVVDRLNQLADVLAGDNATLGNIELSMHIDRIECFQDGRVLLRTCKLGLMGDATSLLIDTDALVEPAKESGATPRVTPRRRARLRTEGAPNEGEELEAAAYMAADPDRFAGLPERWFWTDEFTIPESSFWAANNAEAVFRRRREAHLSYAKLAVEFGVTPPTIGAAVRLYLAAHPDEMDIQLPRGGKRRPKFDLAKFADEARQLWIDGCSKEKLAKKYGCSAPTVHKAIAFAYAQEGLPMPTREEARRIRIAEARRLLDEDKPLEEIAAEMKVSDVTARQYLRDSFAAEGKPMPDLRRRRAPPDAA